MLHNGLIFILCIKCEIHESMDLCVSFTEETCGPRTVPDRRRESNETFSPLKVNTSGEEAKRVRDMQTLQRASREPGRAPIRHLSIS